MLPLGLLPYTHLKDKDIYLLAIHLVLRLCQKQIRSCAKHTGDYHQCIAAESMFSLGLL